MTSHVHTCDLTYNRPSHDILMPVVSSLAPPPTHRLPSQCPYPNPLGADMIYSGMCVKGFSRCSWQNGSLPTVQISVSCCPHSLLVTLLCIQPVGRKTENTYRLQGLLDLGVEGAALEGDDGGRGVGIVGDGRAALLAEPAPDGLARGALALPLLDGAVHGELVLEDDAYEGCCGVGRDRVSWLGG